MSLPRFRRHSAARMSLLVAVVAMLLLAVTPAASAATRLPGSFGGSAYGSNVGGDVGPLSAVLGRTAVQNCPCRGTGGKTLTNTVASANVPGLADLGAVTTTMRTTRSTSAATVKATSEVTGLNLLGGLITADVLRAEARMTATSSALTPSARGTTITNLVIAGQAIRADTAVNTVIQLPDGLGSVTIKEVVNNGDGQSRRGVQVNVLRVVLAADLLGLKAGTEIVIGHAAASFTRQEPGSGVSGSAFATDARSHLTALTQELGRTAFVSTGCQGTSGRVKSNSIAGADVPGVLDLGVGTTTLVSRTVDGVTTVKASATVDGVSLFPALAGDLIGATNIRAVANARNDGGALTVDGAGSTFGGLTILGIELPLHVAPNTTIALPALGKVIVNEQVVQQTAHQATITVTGLHIIVDSPVNLFGLPVGTEIRIGFARASVFEF